MTSKTPGVMSILNQGLIYNSDTFMEVLLFRSQSTLLPELYEIFGKEKIQQFLDTFAGTVLRIPDNNMINECARMASIFNFVEKSSDTGTALSELASQYGCTKKEIGKLYLEAHTILKGDEDDEE